MLASKRERNLALVKVLAAAAWADGRLDIEERNRIKEFLLRNDMGPEEIREVELLLERPVSYAHCESLTRQLMGLLTTGAERQEVLAEVEALLRADGEFTADEEEVLDGLKGVMDSLSGADVFVDRISRVFQRLFGARETVGDAGELSAYLKNTVLQRLHDLSEGAWQQKIDAASLNRYTLFGAVLGRVAEAAEGVAPEELEAIRGILGKRFGIEPPLTDWILQAVQESASARLDRQALLSEFNRIAGARDRKDLLDAAFAVAAADGEVTREELEELRLISNFLWLDPRDFHEVRRRWTSANL
jgi:uncharacterized tellurite resistance protein B-like protein